MIDRRGDPASDGGPFGRFRLEAIVKADGRRLTLYSWPEPADPGAPVADHQTPVRGGDPTAGPDAEEQPGV
ncbi:MAG: hypothetical protein H0V87_05570 [Chloroflexi bacterium]|nr:hypothetical protein [Chloroflexota bacterium]